MSKDKTRHSKKLSYYNTISFKTSGVSVDFIINKSMEDALNKMITVINEELEYKEKQDKSDLANQESEHEAFMKKMERKEIKREAKRTLKTRSESSSDTKSDQETNTKNSGIDLKKYDIILKDLEKSKANTNFNSNSKTQRKLSNSNSSSKSSSESSSDNESDKETNTKNSGIDLKKYDSILKDLEKSKPNTNSNSNSKIQRKLSNSNSSSESSSDSD